MGEEKNPAIVWLERVCVRRAEVNNLRPPFLNFMIPKTKKSQARREKAWRKKEGDRALIHLEKERQELWQMIREAPLRKLEEPFQRGWVRYFVLSDEAFRRKDSDRFLALLEYVQNRQYSRDGKFLKRPHWKSRRLRPRKHFLRMFSVRATLRQKMPEELLSYLMTQNRRPVATQARLRELLLSGFGGQIRVRYPQYYLRVVEPYLITHVRVALPDVERRLAEVDGILEQAPNLGRLKNRCCSRSSVWKQVDEECQNRKVERLAIRDMKEALLEYEESRSFLLQERVVRPPSLFHFLWVEKAA